MQQINTVNTVMSYCGTLCQYLQKYCYQYHLNNVVSNNEILSKLYFYILRSQKLQMIRYKTYYLYKFITWCFSILWKMLFWREDISAKYSPSVSANVYHPKLISALWSLAARSDISANRQFYRPDTPLQGKQISKKKKHKHIKKCTQLLHCAWF